jgi:hypothetical protein
MNLKITFLTFILLISFSLQLNKDNIDKILQNNINILNGTAGFIVMKKNGNVLYKNYVSSP